MLSLIAAPNHLNVSPLSAGTLNFPAISYLGLVIHPTRRRLERQQVAVCFDFVAAKENGRQYESSWCCWCRNWESEGDFELETEILEFMAKSEKPNSFPTKKELVDSGRFDLVEAIVKRGDWLSLGWDLDDEEEKVEGNYMRKALDCDNRGGVKIGDIGDFEEGFESSQNGDSLEGGEDGSSGFPCVFNNSSQSASSSGRSLEIGAQEDTGIEGILNRLEKEREFSFGANLEKIGYNADVSKSGEDDWDFQTSKHTDSADLERSSRLTSASPNKDIFSDFGGKLCHNRTASDFNGLKNSLEPLTWRSWSIKRAGFTLSEFEAAEISFNGKTRGEKEASKDEISEVREGTSEALDKRKEINDNRIQTQLQYLELELASTLRLLLSKSEETISNEDHESSSKYIRKLSDAWEFQENEFMNAQNRLRSIHAKLAILEGKMALSIMYAQFLSLMHCLVGGMEK